MPFTLNQNVNVRVNKNLAWSPGVVSEVDSKSYLVTLTPPVHNSDLYGRVRTLAPGIDVSSVRVHKSATSDLIQAR